MKERVREAAFNLLGPAVRGKWAIDLFAGTGALGLEAMSRGATAAIFIERHLPTVEKLRGAIAALACDDRTDVFGCDSFFWWQHMAGREFTLPTAPWVVFCSPPYDLYIERSADLRRMVDEVVAAAPADSRILVEADQRFEPSWLPDPPQWDVRSYPPAILALLKVPATAEENSEDGHPQHR